MASLRERVARAAFDNGLREILPSVFHGELTGYRRSLLVRELDAALRRSRPYHLELLTLPEGHYVGRFTKRRS